jgi:hypothetical protein
LAYLLTAFTVYQFVFRILHLQNSTIYFIANPYLLFIPLVFIWLGAAIVLGKRVDRNTLVGWCLILTFPSVMLRNFDGQAGFFFLYLRGLQFFWGPLLIVPGLLGLFRLVTFVETSNETTKRYLTTIATIAGSLTLFELFAVDLLHIAPLTFPWVGSPDDPHPQDLNPFRPWGLPSATQPNALLLAYIFWLAILYRTKGFMHKIAAFCGVALSGSGTGQLGLALLSPLALRRPWLLVASVILPLTGLVVWATFTNQYAVSGGMTGRFDLAYGFRLAGLFIALAQRFFSQFNINELLFGNSVVTSFSVIGLTHDWAYLDVFYVYGLVGVIGYLMLFGSVLYFSLPLELDNGLKVCFALAGLALNFHYGTLNYYVGQFLFSSLAALQLNRLYSRAVIEDRSMHYQRPITALPGD